MVDVSNALFIVFFINSKKKIIVFRNIKIKMEYNTFFLVKMNAT